ncbi:MAG: transposase [Bryobacteraceae bacterium]
MGAISPLLSVTAFYRRRLPHYHCVGAPIFITWRLHGSLPGNRKFSATLPSGQAFVAMNRILDSESTGPLFLRMPEIAHMVVDAIEYREWQQHYRLHSYTVMPNHVHLLITPLVDIPKLMQSLKRFTARQGNRILSRGGQPFWQDESYDRLVRDDREFQRIAYYIEMNPVRAGLAASPEEFLWSSAGRTTSPPRVANPPHGL